MKKLLFFVLYFCTFFLSCESYNDFNGAWALKESYDYWKAGGKEDIVAKESKVGNTIFMVITHSIIISSQKLPGFISVPGGKWKIVSIKIETPSKYVMELVSFKNNDATALLYINKNSDLLITFEIKDMSDIFKSEFDQSFLMIGDKFPYILCDKKK